MRNRSLKIPSFTLVEIIFGLIISIIVIGLGYSAFRLLSKDVLIIQNNYRQGADKDLLEQQLTIDFNRFQIIQLEARGENLKMKTPLDSIEYTFLDNLILREKDTLYRDNFGQEFFWQGNNVDLGNIDALKIYTDEESDSSFIFICRENDAMQFMNRNEN